MFRIDKIFFNEHFLDDKGRASYSEGLKLPFKVATAELSIDFRPNSKSSKSERRVFSDSMVVDAKVVPPENPVDACGKGKEGASKGYSSAAMAEKGEMIATVLNLNGLLCAQVTDVKPLKVGGDVFEVTCVQYRGGSATTQYIVNSSDGTAYRP